MGSPRAARSLALVVLALFAMACESRQAMLHPHWSEVRHVSPPLRAEDGRLVLHVPDFEAGRVLLGLDQDLIRLSHEINVVHLPAGEYEFVIGILAQGRSVGMSFPVELGSAQTRYYHVELPIEGRRNVVVTERTREELSQGFVRRNPFVRSFTKQTGAFSRAFLRRDSAEP